MMYVFFALGFLGIFLLYSFFFSIYVREIKKAESHVGFLIPKTLKRVLKTTLTFSYISAVVSSLYFVYTALIISNILQ